MGLEQKETRRSLARSTVVIGGFTLMSRVLGFVRDILIALYFGTGTSADAFFVAFRIPNLLRRLLGEGALSASFVPVLSRYLVDGDKEEVRRLVNSAFTLLLVVLSGVLLFGELFTPAIVKVVAPGFSSVPSKFTLTVGLTRVTFPYIFFIGLVVLAMGILNSLDHFAIPAFGPVLLNVSMILCLVLLHKAFNVPVYALAWGVFGGGVLQLLLHGWALKKKGYLPRLSSTLLHPGVKETLTLMLPAFLGLAITQINTFVDTVIASFLPPGSVSYLYYANRLFQFPLGVFGIALGTAVLPTLSRQVARNQGEEVRKTLSFGLTFVWFVTVPAMAGLILFSRPMVQVLFQRGAFTQASSKATALALVCYALGLWSAAASKVAASVFYARKEMKTIVIFSSAALILNIVLNLILMIPLKHAGLALATSISSVFYLVSLVVMLHKRFMPPHWGEIAASMKGIGVASLVLVGVCLGYLHLLPFPVHTLHRALWLAGGLLLGMVFYLGTARLFRCKELGILLDAVRRRR